MNKGDKYIFRDAENLKIRTFVGEQKGKYYSKEGGVVGDAKHFCHQTFDFPLEVTYKSDGNVIKFFDYRHPNYIFKYIKSETKLGIELPLTEEQLKKIIYVNSEDNS